MRRIAVTMTAISAALLLLGCGGEKLESRWADKAIQVDGFAEEWDPASLTYFEDLNLSVGLCNDGDYLYALTRLADRMTTLQIHQFGVTFWLSPRGGKREDFGYKFTGNAPKDFGRLNFNPGEHPKQGDMMGNLPECGSLQASAVTERGETLYPSMSSEGPAAAFNRDKGVFTYEFRIPLIDCSGTPILSEDFKPDKFKLGIVIDAPDISGMRPPSGRRGGGRGGAGGFGGGRPGGMGGGGRMSGSGGGKGPGGTMMEEIKLWVNVDLAKKPSPRESQ